MARASSCMLESQSLTRWLHTGILIALTGALLGCASGRTLVPAPTLYISDISDAFDDLDETLRTPDATIIYATDRAPEETEDASLSYGFVRSPSVGLGLASVRIGEPESSWQDIKARAQGDGEPLALSLQSLSEFDRTPPNPLPWRVVDGRPVVNAESRAKKQASINALCAEATRRLAHTPSKQALVYVHGINNTFEDSLLTTTELWHYLGREGVPITFGWPAGRGGLLRGYAYDRESGEFAAYHFKRLLLILSECDAIERIDIIAHSRGCDITLTALRELTIAERAAGRDPKRSLRLDNVVLAAPDLDLGITLQRVISEFVPISAKRFTIYTSPNDKAISLSEFLFSGLPRIGQLNLAKIESAFGDLPPGTFGSTENVSIVKYRGTQGGKHGHSYFRSNPAVLSDLILTLRFDRPPGAEHGRPLLPLKRRLWAIDDDYLKAVDPS